MGKRVRRQHAMYVTCGIGPGGAPIFLCDRCKAERTFIGSVFERIMRGLDGSLAAADFLRSPSLAAWRRESGRTK